MAVKTRIATSMEQVFASGALLMGEIEPLDDFDKKRAGEVDTQARDKETGDRVWVARVIDPDPEARSAEVKVKVSAEHQPVPPKAMPGLPFRPVAFEGLTVTPYISEQNGRPRLAYSFRATGLKEGKVPAPSTSGGQS
jgi:hypothetical protein